MAMALRSLEAAGIALSQSKQCRVLAAEPDDAGPAADLIYLPMGRLADYLFGAGDRCAPGKWS